jgi:hypothetical protein
MALRMAQAARADRPGTQAGNTRARKYIPPFHLSSPFRIYGMVAAAEAELEARLAAWGAGAPPEKQRLFERHYVTR